MAFHEEELWFCRFRVWQMKEGEKIRVFLKLHDHPMGLTQLLSVNFAFVLFFFYFCFQ